MITDGLLLVDKPAGVTSHDVVAQCRRAFSRKDIGHAGTLDPFATGLLVLLVGKATKLSDYILNGDKAYEATVLLGLETDTDDITGEVTNESPNFQISERAVYEAIEQLTGVLELPVPIYSAVKVKGKKLYEKARKKEDFTPPIKKMEFRDLKILGLAGNEVTVQFACSKGSYVRAWAKALGQKLGCGATTKTLRRLQSQPYAVENTVKLDDVANLSEVELCQLPGWVPLNQCLPSWPQLLVEGQDEKLILNGQIPRKLERYMELEFSGIEGLQGVKLLSKRNKDLLALLSFIPPLGFKIRRVFPRNSY